MKLQYVTRRPRLSVPTIAAFLQLLPKGFAGERSLATDSTIYNVVEDTASAASEARRLSWGPPRYFRRAVLAEGVARGERPGRLFTHRIGAATRRSASGGKKGSALSTTLVGSYPQPEWLIDRAKLAGRFPPRVRAKELWRIPEHLLAEAQNDATVLAIKAQEDAGLDIITDGEIRRESYSNRFATALEGVDLDNPGSALDRSGHPNPVPRIVGRIRRRHPVETEDVRFLRAHTSKRIKITVPGPFTMSQQAQNDFYKSVDEAAMDYAAAVNEEIKDLFAAGADIVQIDEPYMQRAPRRRGSTD